MSDKTIRVLSIEDSPADAALIQEKLAEAQSVAWDLPRFEIEHVDRLEAALERLIEGKIDVVLSDLDLPDSQAGETVAALREQIPQMPLVVLTGREDEALARKSVRAGVQDYLYKKEITGSLLARTLIYAIERQETRGKLEQRVDERTLELVQVNEYLWRANQALEAEIAKREQVEDALRGSEARFRAVIESAQDSIFVKDLELRYTAVNPAMEQLLGRPAAELIGLTDEDVFGEEASVHIREVDARVLAGEIVEEEDTKPIRDGDLRTFHVIKVPMYDNAGQIIGLCGIARDVTERKAAEDALRESEANLARAQTIGRLGSWSLNPETNRVEWSAEMYRLFGVEPEDSPEPTLELGFSRVHPEDRASLRKVYEGGLAEGKASFEAEFRTVPIEGQIRTLRMLAEVERDEDGEIVRVFGVDVDITERKRAEGVLRRYAAELQSRNEELDAFAQTVAHDLKNPLSYVIGFADVIKTEHAALAEDELEHYLEIVARSGRRANRIIDSLLLLAGVFQMDVELVPLDMNAIVAEALDRLYWEIRDSQADVILPDEQVLWPVVLGYGPWIEEVWVNYISNAIKYGGSAEESVPPRVELGFERLKDMRVRFWVRDNGWGLTAEEQERLFTPFTRLDHKRGVGHGLGLSIVQRIVGKLGGEVGVESGAGRGSVFYFTLRAQMDGASPP